MFTFLCFLDLRLRFLDFLRFPERSDDPDELLASEDESDEFEEDSYEDSEDELDDDEGSLPPSSISIKLLPSDVW